MAEECGKHKIIILFSIARFIISKEKWEPCPSKIKSFFLLGLKL